MRDMMPTDDSMGRAGSAPAKAYPADPKPTMYATSETATEVQYNDQTYEIDFSDDDWIEMPDVSSDVDPVTDRHYRHQPSGIHVVVRVSRHVDGLTRHVEAVGRPEYDALLPDKGEIAVKLSASADTPGTDYTGPVDADADEIRSRLAGDVEHVAEVVVDEQDARLTADHVYHHEWVRTVRHAVRDVVPEIDEQSVSEIGRAAVDRHGYWETPHSRPIARIEYTLDGTEYDTEADALTALTVGENEGENA